MSREERSTGVICPEHGKVGLLADEYMSQLRDPWAYWQCPLCGARASFDDARYDAASYEDGP